MTLLPRTGGIAERIGMLIGPIGVVGVVASYASALLYDHVVHDFRAVWLVPTMLILLILLPLRRIRIPEGHERADYKELLAEGRKAIADRRAAPKEGLFDGDVTTKDADATVALDALRRLAVRHGYVEADR